MIRIINNINRVKADNIPVAMERNNILNDLIKNIEIELKKKTVIPHKIELINLRLALVVSLILQLLHLRVRFLVNKALKIFFVFILQLQ